MKSAAFANRIISVPCNKTSPNSGYKCFLLKNISNQRSFPLSNSRLHTRSSKNFYEMLGVSQSATQDEIKTAFYTLSKKYHPDVIESRNEISSQKFIEVREAYDILRDAQKKREYDHTLIPSRHTTKTGSGNVDADQYSGEESERIWRTMQGSSDRELRHQIMEKRTKAYEESSRSKRRTQRMIEEGVRRYEDDFKPRKIGRFCFIAMYFIIIISCVLLCVILNF